MGGIALNPWLSICVPTYNRPEALARCLAMLIEQCRPLGVPIVVSDNASTYDCAGLVARFRREYEHVHFLSSTHNLGMGVNFIRVVEPVETRFAWLFSDDDSLAPDAVREMLDACCSDDFDLIIANREYLTSNLDPDRGNVSERIDADETMAGGGELLTRACVRHYTFIGCLCFRTETWRAADPARYQSLLYFPHLCIVASFMANPARRALLLARPIVRVRGGGYSWEKRAGTVWFAELQRCLAAVPGYTNAEKRAALWTAWQDIAQFSLWLVAEHRTRGSSIRDLWLARASYAAMDAHGLFAFNLAALCISSLVPAAAFRAFRSVWRKSSGDSAPTP